MLPTLNHIEQPKDCRVFVLPEEQSQEPAPLFAGLPDVLIVQRVAEALSICDEQVRELALLGKLVGFRVGTCHRFTKQSLIDFVLGCGTDEKA